MHRLVGVGRALLEPGARCGRAPQRLPARIPERPAQRLVVVVHGVVVAGVELEAMAGGIANIEKEGVGDAVAGGAPLHVVEITARGHHVAQMQDVHRGRHPVSEMMQTGTFAVGDGEIMHIALAMHPGGGDASVRAILLGELGQAEAEPGVEIDGALHVVGEHVEVVEPLRMATLVEVVTAQQVRPLVHPGIELDRISQRIGELQRAALERLLGEAGGDAVLLQEGGGLVEVALVADLESHAVAGVRLGLAQHQRVVLVLFVAAEVDGVAVGVFDMQADGVFVECSVRCEIGDVQHDVAGTQDVEWRIEDVLRSGHDDFLCLSVS